MSLLIESFTVNLAGCEWQNCRKVKKTVLYFLSSKIYCGKKIEKSHTASQTMTSSKEEQKMLHIFSSWTNFKRKKDLFWFVTNRNYTMHGDFNVWAVSRADLKYVNSLIIVISVVSHISFLFFLVQSNIARQKYQNHNLHPYHIKITTQWYAYKLLLRHLFYFSVHILLCCSFRIRMRMVWLIWDFIFTKQLHQLHKVCHYFNYSKCGGCMPSIDR